MVVGQREGRRVEENDAHAPRVRGRVKLLIRTWNLFHGRSFPESGDTFLDEMVALATQDDPDVVCLQEVPVWALPELEGWSGMAAVGVVAMPAIGGRFARRATEVHPRRLRSALTGQANAVLIARRLDVIGEESLALDPRDMRRREAKRLGLSTRLRIAWARNRRVALLVRVGAGAGSAVVVNLHLSSLPDSRRSTPSCFARSPTPTALRDPTSLSCWPATSI